MLAEWMAERGAVPAVIAAIDWTIFDNTTLSQPEVDELEAAIAPFLRSLTKAEFFDSVVKRKMLGYPVGDASDSLADPQLRARDFWRHISPAQGLPPLPFPGGFALFDGKRPEVRRPAPRRPVAERSAVSASWRSASRRRDRSSESTSRISAPRSSVSRADLPPTCSARRTRHLRTASSSPIARACSPSTTTGSEARRST